MAVSRRKFIAGATAALGLAALPIPLRPVAYGSALPGLGAVGRKFRVAMTSDHHVGPRETSADGFRLYNQLLAELVQEVNAFDEKAAFTVFNGDLVGQPNPGSFVYFKETVAGLRTPKVLVHGNHDGRHPDEGYQDMLEEINGHRALYYSFDAGDWHFVSVPSRQMMPEPEMEEAYYEWLRNDLDASAGRPTMVFHHYHIFPLGTTQLEFYSMSMDMRKTMLDIFAEHGDVRYVLMGDVHNGIKVSEKTSFKDRGVAYIMAPTFVPPRPFGEEHPDFLPEGERNCGYWMTMEFDGDDVAFIARKLGSNATRRIHEEIPEWDHGKDPRAFTLVPDLPKGPRLLNGGFRDGLEHWLAPHRYMRDEDPCYRIEAIEADGAPAARLAVKHCGTHWWSNDECVEIYQVFNRRQPHRNPVLRASYQIPAGGMRGPSGGFIRASYYSGSERKFMVLFHWGRGEDLVRYTPQNMLYADEGHNRGAGHWLRHQRERSIAFVRIPSTPGQWIDLQANLREMFDAASPLGEDFDAANLDRVLVCAGAWIGNSDGAYSELLVRGIGYEDEEGVESRAGGRPIAVSEGSFQPVYFERSALERGLI